MPQPLVAHGLRTNTAHVRAPSTRPPPEDGSLLARWTLSLVERELPRVAERRALLQKHGLSLDALLLDDARLSHGSACALWEELTDHHEDPLLGIRFAKDLPESALGIVGYLAMSSETPLAGLARVVRYYRLVKNPGAMDLVDYGALVQVVDKPAPGLDPWPRHFAEAVLFSYKGFIERWTGQSLAIASVRLQHEAPPKAHLVETAFGGPVTFGAVDNALVIEKKNLERPMAPHDAALHRYLVPAADLQLERLPRSEELLESLEAAILAALPSGTVTLERMARALGIGVRTLQRRLRSRSRTFQDVVDHVRRTAAARVVGKPGLSVKEFAFLLGFADSKSFRRAQERWQRLPPLS
jgi:AraC-like DNA-binding protein